MKNHDTLPSYTYTPSFSTLEEALRDADNLSLDWEDPLPSLDEVNASLASFVSIL